MSVMLAISNLGNVRAETAQFSALMAKRGVDVRFLINIQPLDHSRTIAIHQFLEEYKDPEDRLWFLDDDIVPPPESLDVLLSHDLDAVGALCLMTKPRDDGHLAPAPIAFRDAPDGKYNIIQEGSGLVEVDAVGLGCLMVKRKVLEALPSRPFQYHYTERGLLDLTADFDFCRKVKAAGFKIHVDWSLLAGHVKPLDIRAFALTLNA